MRKRSGFTLIELLVVIAIIGVLATLVGMNWKSFIIRANRAASLAQMRSIAIATRGYSADNDGRIPRRVTGQDDKWPKLLSSYLDSPKTYAAPGDPKNFVVRGADPLSNSRNNTSYIMNGFNDLGAYEDSSIEVRITTLDIPSQVILFGTPKSGSGHFYMDMLEGDRGNQVDVLNLEFYDQGSNYVFADGSARFIRRIDYEKDGSGNKLWLIDKNFAMR